MKRIIAACILLFVITAACISSSVVIGSCCNEISICIEESKSDFNEKKALAIKESWKKYKTALFLFVNHENLEDIEKHIDLLSTYNSAEREEFIIACDEIIYDIKKIKDKESLSLLSFL